MNANSKHLINAPCTASCAGLAVIMVAAAAAQVLEQRLEFEVISIKASLSSGVGGTISGGPGTTDPSLFLGQNIDLYSLLITAFDMPGYEIAGPEWLRDARVSIQAKVPEGATKSQFRTMQQHLLIDRLKLAFHYENRELPGYDLVVAKNGAKIRHSEPASPPENPDSPPPPGPYKKGEDGFPIIPPDDHRRMLFANEGPRAVQVFRDRSMQQLALYLAGPVGRPVKDATNLTGNYDFTLKWMLNWGQPAAEDNGPTIFQAVEQQLGLRLEARKVVTKLLVVDHIEKIPTDN
jgi:uncharacterized protein (TIGR03435 family)